ncbi:hypothetical protein B0A55_02970 [Friedmanniomyces simplex]|uniref:F-box domain-containing protein n=1 Tax=Friedmanniomyces simplex TaxID=329884 RepID=A0A4U0Y6I9_9PEZI|nr:hypothetical protein B0A55_02970 [Friedmanniomyces simplex]
MAPCKRQRAGDRAELHNKDSSDTTERHKIRTVLEHMDDLLTAETKQAVVNGFVNRHNAEDITRRHLLALPEELRRQIFDYATLEDPDKFIEINEHGSKQPDLLRVCVQVRRETLTRYYTYNRFGLLITDYSTKAILPSYRLQEKYFNPATSTRRTGLQKDLEGSGFLDQRAGTT